jgi:2,4-dichlorophenol 6-monooxygenase
VATVETDVLIVGAGPAGASSAVFLGNYGIANVVISRHRGTAHTPRAHLTNQRTMEVLRDTGLERACLARASPSSYIENSFWLRSMVGEELARSYAWGNDPVRKGDYEAASPCQMIDLPQAELEPILITEATRLGSHVRFGLELLSFEQDENGVTAMVRDRVTKSQITIRAKYMIGADGTRSRIVEQLGIPIVSKKRVDSAVSVYCEVDLGLYLAHRHASLYHCVRPGSEKWGPVTNFRMVRPWDRWIATLLRVTSEGMADLQANELETQLQECIGAPVSVKVLDVSTWTVNHGIADHYSVGRVFCMGDAVHRHSPANGLGSNTSIQDAFNLAWKLALVLQRKADPRLLESFSAERQPVGRQVVDRANRSMDLNINVWDCILGRGDKPRSETEYRAYLDTREGRAALRRALDAMCYENHGHGVELNRHYLSDAIVDESAPNVVPQRDEELFYEPSTRPGAPLPHVWLGKRSAGPLISSLDVAGKRHFTILTGYEGKRWYEAARLISKETGVEIKVVSIGPYLDYEDTDRRWNALCEIDESGCVLVRPDLHIGWRCTTLPPDPIAALSTVMRRILGFEPSIQSTRKRAVYSKKISGFE